MPKKKALFKIKDKKTKDILISYEGEDWTLENLLNHITKKIRLLEKEKCNPSAKCIFEGREYLDYKYGIEPNQTEFIYGG